MPVVQSSAGSGIILSTMDVYTFRDELRQQPLNVARAALRLAQEIAYPGLDVYAYMARLDHLAASAERFISAGAPDHTRAEELGDFLFRQLGFRGNSAEYGDPRNSFLNEVLDRRLGIPITLSIIYMSISQRLGIPIHGVGLPGHFIVGLPGQNGPYYFDPFHGGIRLSVEDCAALVAETSGIHGSFQREWLLPLSTDQILIRLLNNLRLIYIQGESWEHALAVVEHLRLLQPEQAALMRDLGFIHHQSGALAKAVHYYEQYLLRDPDARDAKPIQRALQTVASALARRN